MPKKSSQARDVQRFGEFAPGGAGPLLAMVEVTNRCNMACPVCFSGASQAGRDVGLAQIRRSLEKLLDTTLTPIPIQISGGEPTVRDDLQEIVALAKSLGFRHVELVTNGIRIGEDPALLEELKETGLNAVYLQFDGLARQTHLSLRGRDMGEVRRKAIGAARRAGVCCTLAVTVVQGVNDHELGDVVRFGVENIDTVRAISFQAGTRFGGRFELERQDSSLEMPALLGLIEARTGIPADTFRWEHMGHPLCNAMSIVFVVDGKLQPLFQYISREDVLEFLGEDSRTKVLDLFEGKKGFFVRHLASARAWKLIAKASRIFGSDPRNVLRTGHIVLFAKSFMERQDLTPARIRHCCYGMATEEGVFSFCVYNNLYRFAENFPPVGDGARPPELCR